MNIKDFKLCDYNPRKMNPEAMIALENSMETFEDISGIVVNSRTGNILCGNHRYTAIKNKYSKLELAKLSGEYFMIMSEKIFTGFLVRIVDWDEAKEKMANVTANNTLVQGEFTSGLSDVLDSVKAMANEAELDMMDNLKLTDLMLDFDIDDIDYSDDQIDKIEDSSNKSESNVKSDDSEEIVSHDVIKITIPVEYKDQVRMDILEFLSGKDYYNVINLV